MFNILNLFLEQHFNFATFQNVNKNYLSFCSQGARSPPRDFYFMDNIRQDAGNRTRVDATSELHSTHIPDQIATHIPAELHTSL